MHSNTIFPKDIFNSTDKFVVRNGIERSAVRAEFDGSHSPLLKGNDISFGSGERSDLVMKHKVFPSSSSSC